jgi:hypothetical protein
VKTREAGGVVIAPHPDGTVVLRRDANAIRMTRADVIEAMSAVAALLGVSIPPRP